MPFNKAWLEIIFENIISKGIAVMIKTQAIEKWAEKKSLGKCF
jgi:hypothetical protein